MARPLKIKKIEKSKYNIGDEKTVKNYSPHQIRSEESKKFIITEILDKGHYNMYVCKNKLGGYKESFTDDDFKDKLEV